MDWRGIRGQKLTHPLPKDREQHQQHQQQPPSQSCRHPNPNPKCCYYPHLIDGQTEAPRVKSRAQGHRWSQTAVPRWTSSPAGSPVYSHRGRWEVFVCKARLWTVPMHCCHPHTPKTVPNPDIKTNRRITTHRPASLNPEKDPPSSP